MYKQLEIRKLITEDLKRCEELYNDLYCLYGSLPRGSLVERNGHLYHAFRINGKQTQKRITDPHQIYGIKLRQFLKAGLPMLNQRITTNRYYLENEVLYDPIKILQGMISVYDKVTGYNVFLKDDIDPDKWRQDNYERNTHAFAYEHYTEQHIPVRSKAEAMIGTQFEHRGWLYICEPKMRFGHEIKCPDFAVMMPNTRKVIFFEHFGRMDDLNYMKDTMDKLVLYSRYGLKLGENFFFTWETKDRPLTMLQIESVLDAMEALDQ